MQTNDHPYELHGFPSDHAKNEREKLREDLERTAEQLESKIANLRGRVEQTYEEDKEQLRDAKERIKQTFDEDTQMMKDKVDTIRGALRGGVEDLSEKAAAQLRKLVN